MLLKKGREADQKVLQSGFNEEKILQLTRGREATIANYLERAPGTNVWSSVFVQDGFLRMTLLYTFFKKLNDVKLGDSLHDMVKWLLDTKGDFTLKSYCLKLLHLNYELL